jgi:hypothetical protein
LTRPCRHFGSQRPRGGWPALLGVLAWVVASPVAVARPSRAPDQRRVLLLTDSPGDPLMERIRAEVVSLGMEVVVRRAEGPIDARARAEHAAAAIRMLPTHNGVEVWTADETSGRPLLRQAVVDDKPGGPDGKLIALQTAEVLRTSLFPHPPPEPTTVIVQVAPAPSRATESSVAAGVGLLYGAGGAGPAWQAWLSFQHLWTEHLGGALDVSLPIHRGTMSGPEGTADVGAVTAGVQILARFASERRFFANAGVGAAFAAVLATGHPTTDIAPLVGASTTAYTGLAYARAALGWKAFRWLAVGVSGVAGSTVAPVRIGFAGNDAGSWGVPLVGVALFGQADWR